MDRFLKVSTLMEIKKEKENVNGQMDLSMNEPSKITK